MICSLGVPFAVFVMISKGAGRSCLKSGWLVWRAGVLDRQNWFGALVDRASVGRYVGAMLQLTDTGRLAAYGAES